MKKSKLGALAICLPLGLGLQLTVMACGGSDTGNNQNTGGSTAMSSAGSGTMTSGGTSTAGTTSAAGTSSTSNGGTNNSGGDFMTGLPATTPLSSLTDAQAMQLCSSLENYFSTSLKDFDCRLSGILAATFSMAKTDADAQAACKSAYDMCNAAAAMPSMDMCSKPTGMCTATVGELEKCANDDSAVFDQLGTSFPSCADLTLKDLMSAGGDAMQPMEPASCTALDMKCPDGPMPPMMTP